MSGEEEGQKENEIEQEEGSMNIYDDNAYMLGEEQSENNSEEQKQVDYTDNKGNINLEKVKTDSNKKEISKEQSNELIDNKVKILNKLKGEENNQINSEINPGNLNNNINNIDNPINEKNTNDNMDINEHGNPNEEYEENEGGEEGEEDGEVGEENEGEGEEEENIPLVTLKCISICQYCKNTFKSTVNIPYLLKCGHFFCLKCINEHFTDEEGIKCPNDGLVALSIKELKLLNNLITDKNIPSQRDKKEANTPQKIVPMNGIDNNNCKIHRGQKLTHIVTETKQLICIYCAFDLVRKNPKCEVKEIKEKFEEFVTEAEKIINLNQNNIKIIQDSLKDIKKNKEMEEKNINTYFGHIFKYLNNKKGEYLSQIDSIFTENAKILSQKLEIFSDLIEQGENLKGLIENYDQKNNFDEILEVYNNLQTINSYDLDGQISLQEYKFAHDDETKILRYINNFGDIKTVNKYVAFQNGKKGPFHLRGEGNQGPMYPPEEPKKNYFNFNSNPIIINMTNNNKSSSRFTNNSTENQEILNENNYINDSMGGNNNKLNCKNYKFSFNKINPFGNENNNSKRNMSIKPLLLNNSNFVRASKEGNNGRNYINLETDTRNKTYTCSNVNSKNMRGNRTSNGDNVIYNNFYNLNNSKKINDKDNSNQSMTSKSKGMKNNFEHPNLNSLGYEYKGLIPSIN